MTDNKCVFMFNKDGDFIYEKDNKFMTDTNVKDLLNKESITIVEPIAKVESYTVLNNN